MNINAKEIEQKAKFARDARLAANHGKMNINDRIKLINAAQNAELFIKYSADLLERVK